MFLFRGRVNWASNLRPQRWKKAIWSSKWSSACRHEDHAPLPHWLCISKHAPSPIEPLRSTTFSCFRSAWRSDPCSWRRRHGASLSRKPHRSLIIFSSSSLCWKPGSLSGLPSFVGAPFGFGISSVCESHLICRMAELPGGASEARAPSATKKRARGRRPWARELLPGGGRPLRGQQLALPPPPREAAGEEDPPPWSRWPSMHRPWELAIPTGGADIGFPRPQQSACGQRLNYCYFLLLVPTDPRRPPHLQHSRAWPPSLVTPCRVMNRRATTWAKSWTARYPPCSELTPNSFHFLSL